MEAPARRTAPLLRALSAAGAGVVLSGALALAEIGLQGYVRLGFTRSAFELLREGLVRGAAWGVAVGVAAAAAAAVPRSPAARTWRERARARARAMRPSSIAAVAVLAFALPLAGLLGVVRLTRGELRTLALVGAAAWLGLGLVVALGTLGARVLGDAQRRAACAAGMRVLASALGLCAIAFAAANLDDLGNLDHPAVAARNTALLAGSLVVVAFAVPAALAAAREADGRPAGRLAWPARIGAGAALLLVLVSLVGRGVLERPTLAARRPLNVLILAIDTLRHDHTSLFRDDPRGRALTPALAALAERGTRFSHAVSPSPWTLPAFASILTGRDPTEHGALDLFSTLARSELTLAEVLKEAGFSTAASVSHTFVDREHGFAQGVDDFREHHVGNHDAISSRDVSDAAIEILESHDGSRPLFLFAHYFDPHYEYRDHDGFDFADDYDGWLTDEQLSIRNLIARRHQLGEEDVAHLLDRYDEEIAFTDAQIGRVLEALRAAGLEDETAVVVVADHGEEFLEHGWIGHTISLHDEVIRVPLVLVLPGVEQRALVERPVSTTAVFATLLDGLGIDARPGGAVSGRAGGDGVGWEREVRGAGDERGPGGERGVGDERDAGGSLLPRIDAARGAAGDGAGDGPPIFSIVWMPHMPGASTKRIRLVSARRGDTKLIRDVTRDRTMLYDLAADPGERHDLSVERPSAVAELSAAIDAWLARTGRDASRVRRRLSEDELEELRELGYF